MHTEQRIFTISEANRHIPHLTQLVSEFRVKYDSFNALKKEHETLQNSVEGLIQEIDRIEQIECHMDVLESQLQQVLNEFVEIGVIVRDPYRGLADFPSRLDDADIFLCWEFGESEIAYFHGPDTGYAGRMPLPE